MSDNEQTIKQADASYANAKRNVDRLQRIIQSGHGTDTDIVAYTNAIQQLTSADTAKQSALSDVFEIGTENLTESIITALTTIHTNRVTQDTGCDWNQLPIEFLTTSNTQTVWLELRDAQTNQRYCDKYSEDLDQDSKDALLNERAKTTVANATTNIETYYDSVRNTWNVAVSE